MAKNRFARRTHLDKVHLYKGEEMAGASHSRGMVKDSFREYHLKLLKELLAAPELDGKGRDYAGRSLAWLEADPARRLSFRQSQSFQRLENAVHIKRNGVQIKPGLPSLRLQNQPREVIFKSPRPAWMADPSLLPKKPP